VSALSPLDRELLSGALRAGHLFERSMSDVDHSRFVEALRACAGAESALVQKLSELAAKSSRELGPKHLMALLVPIERLAGRSARDEEFLFTERDEIAPVATRLDHIVLCENIRSAFNVGAIFRTTETFGGHQIWLSGYTPNPLKTAMGTDTMIQTRRFDRSAEAIQEAKKLGCKIVVLENSPGATPLERFKWPEKALLVLGNERFGVDSSTLEMADHTVRISTLGQKNSLNVGVAFGIAASNWAQPSEERATHASETLTPIGHLRGGFENSQIAPRQGSYAAANENFAIIELESRFEGRPSNFAQALKDLDGFERAWVIFGFHQSQGWNPQVRPPRGDGTKRGLFATRSPQRPNRIGISCVKIEAIDISKLSLSISAHDLLEGTPIYDIKPYLPNADAFPKAKAGWVDQIEGSAHKILESTFAEKQLNWLEANGETRLRPFCTEQLTFQPLDDGRKRIELRGTGERTLIGEHHTIAFRTWRIDFRLIETRTVELLYIRGGYTARELANPEDPYLDKTIHRDFSKRWSTGALTDNF
jgi:tRNA-Thr(GGU) m(6)t(6)A37 methyltransferase TsaA